MPIPAWDFLPASSCTGLCYLVRYLLRHYSSGTLAWDSGISFPATCLPARTAGGFYLHLQLPPPLWRIPALGGFMPGLPPPSAPPFLRDSAYTGLGTPATARLHHMHCRLPAKFLCTALHTCLLCHAPCCRPASQFAWDHDLLLTCHYGSMPAYTLHCLPALHLRMGIFCSHGYLHLLLLSACTGTSLGSLHHLPSPTTGHLPQF